MRRMAVPRTSHENASQGRAVLDMAESGAFPDHWADTHDDWLEGYPHQGDARIEEGISDALVENYLTSNESS